MLDPERRLEREEGYLGDRRKISDCRNSPKEHLLARKEDADPFMIELTRAILATSAYLSGKYVLSAPLLASAVLLIQSLGDSCNPAHIYSLRYSYAEKQSANSSSPRRVGCDRLPLEGPKRKSLGRDAECGGEVLCF